MRGIGGSWRPLHAALGMCEREDMAGTCNLVLEEGIGSPGTGVVMNYYVGAGNRT